MSQRELKDKVRDVILRSEFKWRTPKGIARDAGLSVNQVMELLGSDKEVLKARKPNRHGEPLFTLKEKFTKTAGLGVRILSAMTNRLPD